MGLSKKIITEPLLTFLENWYKNPIFSTFNTSLQFNSYLNSKLKNSPTNLSKALIAFSLSKQPYTLEKLKTIETKLIYITGQEDKKASGQYVMQSVAHHLFADGRGYTRIKSIRSTKQTDEATSKQ